MRNIVPNLVYAATGKEVHTVVVAGKIVVTEHQALTLAKDTIRDEAQQQAERIADAVVKDPSHQGLRLMEAMGTGRL